MNYALASLPSYSRSMRQKGLRLCVNRLNRELWRRQWMTMFDGSAWTPQMTADHYRSPNP